MLGFENGCQESMGYIGIMQEDTPSPPPPVSLVCSHFVVSVDDMIRWRDWLVEILFMGACRNKRVCVDLSCWVVQLQTACKAPSCAREKVYLRSLFHRLRALIALNCSLVFVTGIIFFLPYLANSFSQPN